MKLTETNSNLIFLFPIITSLLKEQFIYFILSFSIFFASSLFHFCKSRYKDSVHTNISRYLDRIVATLSYFYMYYFVFTFVTYGKTLFCVLLSLTIVMFFSGRSAFGKRHNIHSYFHIAIGLVAGTIPLFAV